MTALVRLDRRIEHIDTDAAGVVHFTRYLSLLESAVLENLDRLGIGLAALAENGTSLVVVESRLRHQASARFLDDVGIDVSVSHLGAASLRISGTVSGPHGPLATGTLAFGFVDTQGSPAVIPARIATVLKELLR
ncbi:acyl-CoA thioesterase [Amycolatopsis sp. NBC_00345]|uniref:acyl-CoA thioesterase n=1 Tax=Amycolatopsis sp. NBC_00345 TaxID=2975955 RepID=UPI002E254917